MLDPRILARLIDPAALASARPATALDPGAIADALRPFLDATLSDPLPPAAEPEAHPADAIAASPFLLPAASLVQEGQGRGAASPPAGPAATTSTPLLDSLAAVGEPPPGAAAWEQGASLIEPDALLPAAGLPGVEPARAVGEPATPGRTEALWLGAEPISSPGRSPTGASPGGDDWDRSSGELSGLAPRLMQAVERLEAAAQQLARLAGRGNPAGPRSFRGRAAD